MKKTLLFLFILLLSISVQAQNIEALNCEKEEDCVAIADSLLKSAKRPFKLLRTDSVTYSSRNYIKLIYTESSDSKEPLKMAILFRVKQIGANKALEIKGKTLYEFYSMQGKYLDIFPAWKKYINPDADIEKTSDFGGKKEFRKDSGSIEHRYTIEEDQYGDWIILKTW